MIENRHRLLYVKLSLSFRPKGWGAAVGKGLEGRLLIGCSCGVEMSEWC